MLAVEYSRHGGPDVLAVREVPDPQPSAGELLVEVEAIGVNYRDLYEREGRGYVVSTPAIIGVEGAGRIASSGEQVAWIDVQGSYAERVAAAPQKLVPVPEGLSTEVAAAALLQGMTAHYLAYDSYPIAQGDWVLVHAGAGGVGQLLIQLARLRGGRVIATSSTAPKAALAQQAGAEHVIGYEQFARQVRELTGGSGVSAVYDGVGKATFLEGFEALAPAGRMILYGAASGQPDPIAPALLQSHGSAYLQRPTLVTYTRTPELLRERAAQLFGLIADGKLHVRIGHRYPLSEACKAQEDLENRRTTGKLLLIP